jgi:hypothetical protein
MLMYRMPRRLTVAIALLALLLAAEPLVHNHPLGGGIPCALCVSSAHRVPVAGAPAAAPTLVVVDLLRPVEKAAVASATPLPLPSRAPPAAA